MVYIMVSKGEWLMSTAEALNHRFLDKETALKKEERKAFSSAGTLPKQEKQVQEERAAQMYGRFSDKTTKREKRIFLIDLFHADRTLFCLLMSRHAAEFMPIICDPMAAESAERYNKLYQQLVY